MDFIANSNNGIFLVGIAHASDDGVLYVLNISSISKHDLQRSSKGVSDDVETTAISIQQSD